MAALQCTQAVGKFGDPGRIRTSDLKLRRLALYPTELRGPKPSMPGLPGPQGRGKVRGSDPEGEQCPLLPT